MTFEESIQMQANMQKMFEPYQGLAAGIQRMIEPLQSISIQDTSAIMNSMQQIASLSSAVESMCQPTGITKMLERLENIANITAVNLEFQDYSKQFDALSESLSKVYEPIKINEASIRAAIKSHSIQNNKILSKLAVNNHVYVAGYNADELAGCDLKLCGKNEATTSNCFCSFHDTEIFKDIELKNYKYTKKQNFLYAYRAFSKAYYDKIDKRNADIYLFQNCQEVCLSNEGILNNIRGTIIDVEEFKKNKDIFNRALDNEEFDIIETITVTLDYEIRFATSYLNPVSYDFRGEQINDPWDMATPRKNIFVNIFPEAGKSYILISWLRSDSSYFVNYKEQFGEIMNNKDIFYNVMNNMIVCQSDNFAFNPQMIESWDKDTYKFFKDEFVSFLFGTPKIKNIGMDIEKNLVNFKCKFDLFKQ